VERHLNFARNLHIETRILAGEEAASALVEFSRLNRLRRFFWRARAAGGGRRDRPRPGAAGGWLAKDMQVVIVSEREPLSDGRAAAPAGGSPAYGLYPFRSITRCAASTVSGNIEEGAGAHGAEDDTTAILIGFHSKIHAGRLEDDSNRSVVQFFAI
jgi:hypothetical protein